MAKTLPFTFNAQLPEAQAAANASAAKLVVEVSDETMAALRALIVRSISDGIPPREAARIIQGMVGLDTRRALAAMNFYKTLLNQGLPPTRVDVLFDRYVKKKIRERALMIARTETLDALNAGQLLSWEQATKEGLLDDGARKEWIATPLDACPICIALDVGQPIPLKNNFPGGFSGPTAHPACRCALGILP